MNDIITICDLAVLYHVGVPDEEREKPQRLLITLEIEKEFPAGNKSDDLRFTVDYFAVTQRILGFGNGRSWKLIEKLCGDIARALLSEFSADAVTVEVKKFIIPEARYVSVKARRTK